MMKTRNGACVLEGESCFILEVVDELGSVVGYLVCDLSGNLLGEFRSFEAAQAKFDECEKSFKALKQPFDSPPRTTGGGNSGPSPKM
jgi:hypothetical protein